VADWWMKRNQQLATSKPTSNVNKIDSPQPSSIST
jgi:hypothetical protein